MTDTYDANRNRLTKNKPLLALPKVTPMDADGLSGLALLDSHLRGHATLPRPVPMPKPRIEQASPRSQPKLAPLLPILKGLGTLGLLLMPSNMGQHPYCEMCGNNVQAQHKYDCRNPNCMTNENVEHTYLETYSNEQLAQMLSSRAYAESIFGPMSDKEYKKLKGDIRATQKGRNQRHSNYNKNRKTNLKRKQP